jgi:DNA-binding NtrC family response regulator
VAESRILAVDDDPSICRLLEATLTRDGHKVTTVQSAREFLEALETHAPDLCVFDIELPDGNGLDLLKKLRERSDIPAIMLTGNDAAVTAVSAMKLGASDYLTKPLADWQKLAVAVKNSLTIHRQGTELQRLRAVVKDSYGIESIIGSSPKMQAAKSTAQRLASSEANVLVRGESGTGKELFARALHYGGARAKGPFVDVNCAALTESLLESEIFGHEKGAFTGAAGRRIGKFEQADGGTIFLDEIGDMPMPTQAKLLRVLQERAFQRVGGNEKVTVNVRVVSATNKPLEKAVADGQFRQDLFYRINTVTLEIPPLRERREDVPALAQHFIQLAARREGKAAPTIAPDARKQLLEHGWPGNIRELENAMIRAVVLCEASVIEARHLPAQLAPAGTAPAGGGAMPDVPAGGTLPECVEALERRMIADALEKHGWVKARAARQLGLTERILSYKMDTYGIVRSNPA